MADNLKSYRTLQAEKEKLQKELSSLESAVNNMFSKISAKSSKSDDININQKLQYIEENISKKESLMSLSDELMAICNEHFELEFLNHTGSILLDVSNDFNKRNIRDFFKEKKSFNDNFIRKVTEKKGWIGELTIQTSKRVFPVMCKIIPLDSLRGSKAGFSVIIRDITERKEAIKKLIDTKNKAENNMMVRQQFLAKISHEIRTSMSAIIGLSNLLIDKGLDDDKLNFADAIKLSADNLLVIINDILDISKIESGKLTVENVRFDFNKLMLGLKSIFQHKIESGGINFKYHIDTLIPQYLNGDPTRLNQILLNLLSNSEKFTDEGEISLSARLIDKADQKIKLQFIVKDTGIGIAGKNLEKIFHEFIQESDNITRLYGGTGLGLAIVKQLVSLQNGKIWVESSKNKGSSFFLEIEYGISDKKEIKKETEDIELESASIIMAEDYPMNRLLAKNLFKKWGLNLKIVNNGKELVKDLEHNSYDIILMDVQMPKIGGIEATKILRKRGVTTPIIAITGNSFEEEKALCKAAGMNDFLTKPFQENDLKQKLFDYLNVDFKDVDELELNSSINQNLKLEYCDLDYLNELSGGDSLFVEDVLNIFIQEVPELINKIIFGLNSDDKKEVAKYAHRLQSSFVMIRRKDIETELKKLELWAKGSSKIENPVNIISRIINHTQLIVKSISGYMSKPYRSQISPIDFLMSFDELKNLEIDFSKLDEFGQGEKEFKKEIIGLYDSQTSDQIKEVENLMCAKSFKAIALIIHNMIASFNLIGCQTLVNYSRGLEEVCLDVRNDKRFQRQIKDYILLIKESIKLVNKKGLEQGILD
jgi:signal transduction histidine kinase/CheY-like chemotaxis protein